MKRGVVKVAAVILAAGKGTRMLSGRPKVLYEICGKPFLYYTLKSLRNLAGNLKEFARLDGIYPVVGYKAGQVRNAFRNESVRWVIQKKQRGTGDALVAAESVLKSFNGIILVICGDTPLLTSRTLKELIKTHLDSPETAATILTCQLDNPTGYGRIIKDERGIVKGIVEEQNASETQRKIREINSGTYVFDSAVFKALKKIRPHREKGEYYLTDVIEILAEEGKNVRAYLKDDASECLGVNTHSELNAISRLMHRRICNELTQKGVIIVAPEILILKKM